jgi:uncharacterized protein
MPVIHNEPESRFELDLDGATALLDYDLGGNRIAFTHTEVPEHLEGRGYGAQLVRAGLEYARESGLAVVPACSFVAAYIRRNPRYADLVVAEYRDRVNRRRAM